MPTLFQMATPINLSNPLNVFEGNSSLEPSINNNMSLYFNKYFAASQRSINFNIWTNVTENDRVLAQNIDENFRRTSQYVNVEELNYNLNISMGGRVLIKKLKTFVRGNLGYKVSQIHTPINQFINQIENQAWNSSIELSNSNKKVIDMTLRYFIEFNRAQYSIFNELNQNFINHTVRTNISYFINQKWTFRADFNYLYFSQEAFADALSVPLLNANLSYQPKEKSPWTFKINAFDILNQNVVIQRTANMNYIRQTQTNLLTRYVLLSVMYKFKNG